MNRVVFVSLTILCLLSLSSITGLIQVAKAEVGTITINADGSITPSTAPITAAHNATYTFYTFTGNVNASIVVERDNIVVDGQGYTVQGTGNGTGITLSGINDVLIENTNIENFQYGTHLENSSNNTISENNITNTYDGIYLYSSSNNSLSGNNITGNNIVGNSTGIVLESSSNNSNVNGNSVTSNRVGILFDSSSNNRLSGNNITNNNDGMYLYSSSNNSLNGNNIAANGDDGIYLGSSSSNTIYHNNFINNTSQVQSLNSTNIWDDGSGGNYWSDYNGVDVKSGQYQNVAGSDGIGDTPCVIDANNTDNYPLMGQFSNFNIATGSLNMQGSMIYVDVQIVSNFTISDFQFNGTAMLYSLSGVNGTTGFCRVQIPTSLLNGTLSVFVNGAQVQYNLLPSSNSSINYLYFTYGHSTEQVTIVPEFPGFLTPAMLMLAILSAITIHKKKHSHC